jgi:hypothetical protein
VVINVLTETVAGMSAQAADAGIWQDDVASSIVVLADDQSDWLLDWGGADGTSQHSFTVIDASGKVTWRLDDGSSTSVDTIVEELDNAL